MRQVALTWTTRPPTTDGLVRWEKWHRLRHRFVDARVGDLAIERSPRRNLQAMLQRRLARPARACELRQEQRDDGVPHNELMQ